MSSPSQQTGRHALLCKVAAALLFSLAVLSCRATEAQHALATAAQGRIPVRYTDVRQAAGITFQQDSTQTDEKYYLETMGTGVAWIDYDQHGLMDFFCVQSASTDIYNPAKPQRAPLC